MEINNNVFYRSISSFDTIEDESSRRISGQAIVFDSWSKRMIDGDGRPFFERIKRESITQELIDSSDIIMNLNHNDNQMLARWHNGAGTLNLELREDGLYFSFDAPETALGDEVLHNVRSGNLFECSFRFSLNLKEDIRSYKEDGEYRVDIEKIRSLADCSIVTHGAYAATSVYVRSEEDGKEEEVSYDTLFEEVRAAEEEEARIAEEARLAEEKEEILRSLDEKLAEFYKNIDY